VIPSSAPATRQIARAAGTVMLAFVLSNLTGLLRQILVARAFGTGLEMEAFNAANRVSETLFNLVAGGALASAFIPTFTELLTKKDRENAWKLASSIFNIILIVLAISSGLAAVFAPQIVRYVLAPGFSVDPFKESLTVNLLVIMLPSAIIFSASGLVMGILNSHQVFFIPALTPSMYQLGMIFGLTVLSPRMGIYGLAWGVVIGAGLHLILQLPALFHQRLRYHAILGMEMPAVREVGRLMLPRLLGVAVVQLNFWVNTRLASQQPEGSVTGIVVAFTLMLMPEAAIAQSIAIAALPTLSAQYALGKLDHLRSSLASSLRGVLLLSLPASLGMILLRKPIIVLLYQRGEFGARSTELVAWALLWYTIGLVFHSMVEILARAFYSMHDTRTPVFVGVIAMSFNVLFSILFSNLFRQHGWMPHGGLALANSVATALEMAGLFVLMRKKLVGIEGGRLFRGLAQSALGCLAMGLILWFWLSRFSAQPAWLTAGGGILSGAAAYGLILLLMRVPEVRLVLRGELFKRSKLL
jgi:putative peptidoglycan lipid II flippase